MKQEIPPAAIIGAAIVVLLLVVVIGWKAITRDKPRALDAKGIAAARQRKEAHEDK